MKVEDMSEQKTCTMQIWEVGHTPGPCFAVQVQITTRSKYAPVLVLKEYAQSHGAAANLGTVMGRHHGAEAFVLLPGARRGVA